MKKKTKVEYVSFPTQQQNSVTNLLTAWRDMNASVVNTRISLESKAKVLSKKELREKHWEKVDELFW